MNPPPSQKTASWPSVVSLASVMTQSQTRHTLHWTSSILVALFVFFSAVLEGGVLCIGCFHLDGLGVRFISPYFQLVHVVRENWVLRSSRLPFTSTQLANFTKRKNPGSYFSINSATQRGRPGHNSKPRYCYVNGLHDPVLIIFIGQAKRLVGLASATYYKQSHQSFRYSVQSNFIIAKDTASS